MERPPRSRGANFFKYLPKAATFAIRNPPYSPGRDRRPEHPAKAKAFHSRAFSGPIISIVPEEARGRKAAAFEAQEPTSPKVSCMGQIKHKKKNSDRRRSGCSIKKMFRRKVQPGRSEAVSAGWEEGPAAVVAGARAPGIGQMRRFTSGRESLSGFDWREAQRMGKGYVDGDDDDEVIVPHSAPILMGGGLAAEPKKELNIWKRRTLAPPIPLQLSS